MSNTETATLTTAEIVSRLRALPSPTRLAAAERLERLTTERDVLRAALNRIALGDGYYGAQAREYKQVARAALAGQPEPAAADERDAAHG